MPKEVSVRDRFLGCLTGLAAGDAVGCTVEFRKPGTFEPVTGMTGGGTFGLKAGQWTDDTALALCLATSLLECGGFDERDQIERYRRFYREGYLSATGECFDIGQTVKAALERYERTGNPRAGDTDRRTAGNGSIMRLAPVAMRYAGSPREAVKMAAASSLTTHGAVEAVDGCRYLCGLLVGALRGDSKEALLGPCYAPEQGIWMEEPLTGTIHEVAAGSFARREPPRICGSGYVVRSLEAALWAFHRSETFEEGCLAAANLGDDADTTAAVFGQLAGAYYGVQGIPRDWAGQLAKRDLIEETAVRLLEASAIS